MLNYKPKFDYLGVIVSDTGILKDDVKSFTVCKNGNVSVKYTNFCKTNKNAPLHVKAYIHAIIQKAHTYQRDCIASCRLRQGIKRLKLHKDTKLFHCKILINQPLSAKLSIEP